MGNRTALWLLREPGEPEMAFEANNALPLYWCAAFREADLAPWAEAARADVAWEPSLEDRSAEPPRVGPLELRLPWDAARANLRDALRRAPARVPGHAPRLAAFVAALEAEAARHGATGLRLDAAEWMNFHSQAQDAADALGAMIAVWHGDGPPRAPTMHWTFELDGEATDPALMLAQKGWPAAPLDPLPPAPPQPGRWGEWAWVAGIVAAVIGTYAATGSAWAAAGAFAAVAAVFLWVTFRGR